MTFTIAEDVQLMLKERPGRLEYENILPAAGALIELTLLGRLTSIKTPGFFITPVDRLLTVVDGAPEGGKIHQLTGVPSAFTPDYAPEEMFEIASKLYKKSR